MLGAAGAAVNPPGTAIRLSPARNPDRARAVGTAEWSRKQIPQGRDMSDANNWNEKVIADFRANAGQGSGPFEGAPMVLVHHRGRRSGQEYVNPMMYLASEGGDGKLYVFASKGGAPTNPDWYYNLTAAGAGTVELGTGTFPVTVREIHGEEHDRIYAE